MADRSAGAIAIHVAVPGGILLGAALAWPMQWISRFVVNTLGGNLLQLVTAYGVWLIAEPLGLSAVLTVVAFAVMGARSTRGRSSPRMRIQSFAVWAVVVFDLNVTAFLLMGMQARTIIQRLPAARSGVLTAFAVVLATLVVQGLTLTPVIRLLGLHLIDDPEAEVADARGRLVEAAPERLRDLPDADEMAKTYAAKRDKHVDAERGC